MEELHRIIQSMSKDEKREFKLSSSVYKNSKEANHIRLFDFLEKMKDYDSKAIQKKVKEDAFGKQFAITKQKLWDLVLRTLANSDRDLTMRKQISRDIEQIDILIEHGCYKSARRKIVNALKNAIAIEHQLSIMKLCTQYTFVAIDLFVRGEPVDNKIYTEIAGRSVSTYQQQMYFFDVNMQLKELIIQSKFDPSAGTKYEHVRAFVDKMLDKKIPAEYQTLQVKFTQFISYNLLNHHYPDQFPVEEKAKEMIKIFESNPIQLKENLPAYISVLFVTLNGIRDKEDWREFDDYLKRLESVIPGNKSLYENYFLALQSFRMQRSFALLGMKDFSQIYEEGRKFIAARHDFPVTYINLEFYLLASKLFFSKGNFKKSLELTNYLLNEVSKESFEVHSTGWVLFLFIHINLRNLDVVHRYLDAYKKNLEKWNFIDPVDELLIPFFKKVSDEPQIKATRAAFKALWSDLQPYNHTTRYRMYFGFVDFGRWMES